MKRSEANERHDGPDAFRRFEDLTKRLLSVPKQEADKERAKKERKKER